MLIEKLGKYKKAGGIYIITNTNNGKIYIGSTINLYKRFKHHSKCFKSGKHTIRFQRAYDKYINGFIFKPLKVLKDTSKLNLLLWEQYFLDKYQPYHIKIGYNTLPIAGSSKGLITSTETKAKLSKLWLNKERPECRPKCISNGGKRSWVNNISKARLLDRGNQGKYYYITTPQGVTFEIRNLRQFCENNNLYTQSMRRMLRGKVKHHKGYKGYKK